MLKTFAEDLKSIREEKNLSLRDISSKTRINISILENLETGEYNFQPQAYIRAFLKQYLAAMDLDVEDILFEYDLARSGKYKSKRQNTSPLPVEKSKKELASGTKETKLNLSEKLKEIVETPKKKNEEKNSENQLATEEITFNTDSGIQDYSDKKHESKYSINPDNKTNISSSNPFTAKNSFSFTFLNSPLWRNIFIIVFISLVLLGIYSLINILFFEGGNNKPEVIRQNFDDVVKEQERKFLGMRTPEEIQDSIRKAGEEIVAPKDSIILKILSSGPGIIFLVKDSANYNKPVKIEYKKNEIGIYKASKTFHISSANTENFKVTLNDNPIKFDSKSVSKVKVTKDGVIK